MKADGALENTMEAVVTEFNAALEEAKALVAKEDATQAELKDSAVRLLAAMAKVDWKQGDKMCIRDRYLQILRGSGRWISPDVPPCRYWRSWIPL